MAKHLIFILVITLVALAACEPEQEKLTFDSSASLRFSTDSIIFDTLFTSTRSITRRFKVFNDSENAVEISNVQIAGGSDSPYKLFVNGQAGVDFEKTKILGEDSLLILVEATIDPTDNNMPFLVTDEVRFETNGNNQDVKLVAWGQDAVFINGEVLPCNTIWTADRPYVIYNSVLVDSLCNLIVEAGARIYSHNGSYLFVEGIINVLGQPDERVLFRNDRLDVQFENVPGQWGGIIFLPGSEGNTIEYADIRNAEFGVYLGTPDDNEDLDLTLGNSRIENMGGSETFNGNIINIQPGYGILAITSDLYAYNTIVNNCAVNTVGNYAGGNYRYEHCTFANYSFDFFRNDASVVFADNLDLGNSLLVGDLNVEVTNSIIWGSLSDELVVSNGGNAAFNINVRNSLMRTMETDFDVNDNILNEDPLFKNPREYVFELDTLSPAMDAGIDIDIASDLKGTTRQNEPDLGALERIEN